MAESLPIPTGYAQAAAQVYEAQAALTEDYSHLPQLPWSHLADLTGAPLPRDLWVIGARPANGKSAMCLALLDHFVALGEPTLYIGAGSEGPPKDLRRQWAALRCGYPAYHVLENRWDRLGPEARDRVFDELQRQSLQCADTAIFADVGERLDAPALRDACALAERRGVKYVILDHIHRIRFDAKRDVRQALSDCTRWLRDKAAKLDWVIFVAAQLHRAPGDKGPLRELIPPSMADLKETGTLEEDAVIGLLLHRTRKPSVGPKELAAVTRNAMPISEVIEPNTMCVRVGKHRRRGHVQDRTAFLTVESWGGLTARESPYVAEAEDRVPF